VSKVITDSGIHTSIVFGLDLTLIVPAFLIRAALLWRGRSAGLVLGVSLNVLGVIYMVALACAGGFQANAGISGHSWAAFPYIELAVTSIIATVLLLWCPLPLRLSPAGGMVCRTLGVTCRASMGRRCRLKGLLLHFGSAIRCRGIAAISSSDQPPALSAGNTRSPACRCPAGQGMHSG
jgi:hypothetical protein